MQEHDNQIFVPPSFMTIYCDERGRLRVTPDELRLRSEFCEDLANALVEQAQILLHVQAPSETQVLLRIFAGLAAPDAGLAPKEPAWIVARLAELLSWACPLLPAVTPVQDTAPDSN